MVILTVKRLPFGRDLDDYTSGQGGTDVDNIIRTDVPVVSQVAHTK